MTSSVESRIRVQVPVIVAEQPGQYFRLNAPFWVKPIDYTVECVMRACTTAILPGRFGNCSSYFAEAAMRVTTVALGVLCFPLSLALFAVGRVIDQTGDLPSSNSYCYLRGQTQENRSGKPIGFLSANVCMLPYGIATFAGIGPGSGRIDRLAEEILRADQDFVCLQELDVPFALSLWEKIKGNYEHGFTRIGPMPAIRTGGALFFAAKRRIEEVKYIPLPNEGPIVRGLFCARTEIGWIINTHLSAGERANLRKKQMDVIVEVCEGLSEGGKVPCFVCMDSNILRTGKEGDEYAKSGIPDFFLDGCDGSEPFRLNSDTATCTHVFGALIQGGEPPQATEEAFERIDCILCYKPSSNGLRLQTTLVPAYQLDKPEEALSDHHMLSALLC